MQGDMVTCLRALTDIIVFTYYAVTFCLTVFLISFLDAWYWPDRFKIVEEYKAQCGMTIPLSTHQWIQLFLFPILFNLSTVFHLLNESIPYQKIKKLPISMGIYRVNC